MGILKPVSRKAKKIARIVTLIVAMLIEASSGTLYAFSVLSDPLANQLGYTQTELAVIVGIGDNGLYISQLFVGLLNDKFGPTPTSLLAAVCVFIGYGCMALTYNFILPNSHFILFAFYFCLAGIGSSAMHMAAMSTNVKNFHSANRGKIVGILMSLFGLSALIFSTINSIFFVHGGESDTFSFLLFMAIALTFVSVLGALFLTQVGVDQDEAPKAIITNESRTSEFNDSKKIDDGVDRDDDGEDQSLLRHEHKPSEYSQPQTQVTVTVDVYGWKLFKSRDFWMLFYIAMVIAGAGLMYINYVGKVVSSLSDNPEEVVQQQALQVSLISALSCVGRLSSGFLSDFLLHRFGIRRRVLIPMSTTLMLIGVLLVSFIDNLETLWVCTIFIGFAYGSLFSITPTVMSERFGVGHFGINWGWICIGVAAGGQIMSLIFGAVYDSNADPDTGKCTLGAECYVKAFYLNVITVASTSILGIIYSIRRK